MRQLITFVALLAVLRHTSAVSQPNIIFILADDYGFNDVGYHGSEIETPNLDQLAADGIKLENYYVQPICTPSRSNLLSGRHQIRTGLQHMVITPCQNVSLPLDVVTLPQRLKSVGYSTHMVGKWHLGHYTSKALPTSRGFDSFFGYLNGAEDYYNHSICTLGKPNLCGYDLRMNITPTINYTGKYSAQVFTDQASQVIQKHDKSKPLFLYMAYQSVHAPLQVPESYVIPYNHIHNKNRRTYAGMVSAMDEGIGNLTAVLKANGRWENTFLVFSSDNGGMVFAGANNAPLRGMKGTYFEGGVRAVGFVSGPLAGTKGIINRQLIHVSDWYPTLVKLAGGEIPSDYRLDGIDQWKSITQNQTTEREELFYNIDPLTPAYGKSISEVFDTSVQAALRMGNYKIITGNPVFAGWVPEPKDTISFPWYILQIAERLLIKFFDSLVGGDPKNVWLFDIVNDPEERTDLSQSHPDLVEKMLQRLAYFNSTAVPVQNQANDPRCDPALHGGFWGPWVE